jgi:hypothetical protein
VSAAATEPEQGAQPWRVSVPYGWARIVLGRPFPATATVLRGAVPWALFGDEAHVDWHQHLGTGENRQTAPPILYRVRDGVPLVYAWGPHAHQHLAYLARELHALRLPQGEILDVEGVDLRLREEEQVGVSLKRWWAHEIRDYFPSQVVGARRPRGGRTHPHRAAWAEQALASSISMWLREVGLEPQAHRPVHVRLEEVRHHRVAWRGDKQVVWGFSGRLTTNARLPDGIGLGQHRSEGCGEVCSADR